MSKAKSAIPEGFRSLTPYLILDQATNFFEFIKNAFGAREKFVARGDDGRIQHAEAWIGSSIIEFADANAQYKAMPAALHYYVPNADEVYARALVAEATSLRPPTDQPYGDREGDVRDPAGNFWFIATHTAGKTYKPDSLEELNTYFSVKDSVCFLEFLEKAFRGEVVDKHLAGDSISHATVRIGDMVVELSEGREPWGPRAVAHHYYVENCDEVFARAVAQGCKELQSVKDQIYGDRLGSLVDAWGNHWYIASHQEDLTAEEIAERATAASR